MATKDAFYFPHDSNASRDLKMIKLRRIHGLAGPGLYWAVVELLREAASYRLPLKSIEDICFELRTEPEMFESLFECALFQKDDEFFWSNSLCRRMSALDEKREQAKTASMVASQKRKKASESRSSPSDNRPITERSPSDNRPITERSPSDNRPITERSPDGEQAESKDSPPDNHSASAMAPIKGEERRGKEKKGDKGEEGDKIQVEPPRLPLPLNEPTHLDEAINLNELASAIGKLAHHVEAEEIISWQSLKARGCTLEDVRAAKTTFLGRNPPITVKKLTIPFFQERIMEERDIRLSPKKEKTGWQSNMDALGRL